MTLKDWSSTPASNNSAAPNGWPESTMLVNQINDTGRQMMADVRAWYEDAQWIDYGHTPSRVSATVFSVPGTHSGTYSVNRRIRVADAATYLGSISAVTAAGGITSVTLALDTGSLTGSLSAVSVAAVTEDSLPAALLDTADIGVSVEAFDAAIVKADEATTYTAIQKWAKGADIASATALTLGTDGNYFDVTGTTTITSINAVGVGTWVCLHFDAALTLTHHAADLILPGAANITTAAGDEAVFIEYAAGDWRCVGYTRASGEPIAGAGGSWVFASEQSATSATALDWTGLPSDTVEVMMLWDGLDINNTAGAPPLIQLGDSGGIETSGYVGGGWDVAVGATASTAGFICGNRDTIIFSGSFRAARRNATGHAWIGSGVFGSSISSVAITGGSKTLSAALDRVRLTTVGGTATFEGGTVSLWYRTA